jgi:hypothetical protein
MLAPETCAASALARNRIAFATSSGWPHRRSGTRSRIAAAGPSGSVNSGRVCGVSVIAGLTALTRMPSGPPSTANW